MQVGQKSCSGCPPSAHSLCGGAQGSWTAPLRCYRMQFNNRHCKSTRSLRWVLWVGGSVYWNVEGLKDTDGDCPSFLLQPGSKSPRATSEARFSYLPFFSPFAWLLELLILSLCSFVLVVVLVRTYFLWGKRVQSTYYEKLVLTHISILFLETFPYMFSQSVIKL